MYMHGIPPIDVARRTVILVDDGIATGGTVRAALKGLRKLGPARLILAVPVGPPDMLAKLGQECDELVCLAEPAPFFAVGAHYGHFDQTSDEEVMRRLQQPRLEKAGRAGARCQAPPSWSPLAGFPPGVSHHPETRHQHPP